MKTFTKSTLSILLAPFLVAGFGVSTGFADTDRIITGSGEATPEFVQTGPQMFERYEIATARSGTSSGGSDGVITGAEQPLKSLTKAGDSVQRFVDSLYPGANGYRADGRVDP